MLHLFVNTTVFHDAQVVRCVLTCHAAAATATATATAAATAHCCPPQVNCQDANGHTALHIAALLNHHHLIGPLLAAGVDASLRDKSLRTAQELALDKGSDDVLRQLEALKL